LKEAIKESDPIIKGNKFEEVFNSIVCTEPDFTLLKQHARSDVGEIDFFYRTKCKDHPLWLKCHYLFIECKNWKEIISSEKMNHFITLLQSKNVFRNCCGVYVTTSSYSPQAINAYKKAINEKKLIIVKLGRNDLNKLIDEGFKTYLEDAFDTLLSKI